MHRPCLSTWTRVLSFSNTKFPIPCNLMESAQKHEQLIKTHQFSCSFYPSSPAPTSAASNFSPSKYYSRSIKWTFCLGKLRQRTTSSLSFRGSWRHYLVPIRFPANSSKLRWKLRLVWFFYFVCFFVHYFDFRKRLLGYQWYITYHCFLTSILCSRKANVSWLSVKILIQIGQGLVSVFCQ